MADEQIYMVAITPQEGLRQQLEQIRKDFSQQYHVKKALRLPVHITIVPPFRASSKDADAIAKRLKGIKPNFDIVLGGYGGFAKNKVVYINVQPSHELLELRNEVYITIQDAAPHLPLKQEKDFHPHITLGYRDLDEHVYKRAMQEYEGKYYEAKWQVRRVEFWRHNGRWHVYKL